MRKLAPIHQGRIGRACADKLQWIATQLSWQHGPVEGGTLDRRAGLKLCGRRAVRKNDNALILQVSLALRSRGATPIDPE